MNRPSALNVTRYCGQAGTLAAKHNVAGRAAAMSSAFHAKCAGLDTAALMARLTEDERDELSEWLAPEPHTFDHGDVFDYVTATKEKPVKLTANGELITEGTPDAWQVQGRTLYVADLKRSKWTTSEGPRSLQLACYAFAIIETHKLDVDGFACGIWDLTGGSWDWGAYNDLSDLRTMALYDDVVAAALNDGPYATGSHCGSCYARFYCPAHMLPAHFEGTALAPLAEPGGIERMTDAERYELKLKVDAAADLVERVDKELKAYATRHGIPDGKGKIYAAVEMPGRKSVSVADVVAAGHPELVKQSKGYVMLKWLKVKE